jgi:hypothetical protein
MMRLLIRPLQRLAILGLGIVSVWLIVFVLFDFADPTLGIGAWLLLGRSERA